MLPRLLSPTGQLVRADLARRLVEADAALPPGIRLRVVEGHRSPADQRAIVAAYTAELRTLHGDLPAADLGRLTSRFVAPLEVAPHVAGAAVDLTLVDVLGDELDLGTPIDATPEQSDGRCYFAALGIGADARAHRELLARVLGGAGLVNYPTEWWHWSYGDRYWALTTGAPARALRPGRAGGRGVTTLATRARCASRRRAGAAGRPGRDRREHPALRGPDARCADGRGQGRRLRARGRSRRPYLPRPRRLLAGRHHARRGARPARGRAARPGAQLAQPGRRRLPTPPWLPTSTSPCRARRTCGRSRSPAWPPAPPPGCTCTWTSGWPATARLPASGTGCAGPPRRRSGPASSGWSG